MSEWNLVKESPKDEDGTLPPVDVEVLVWDGEHYSIAEWDSSAWYGKAEGRLAENYYGLVYPRPKYWMPLPEAPK